MGCSDNLFVVLTETYAVDLSVDVSDTHIHQIYVLRKAKRGDVRFAEDEDAIPIISPQVVVKFFEDVKNHLERNWISPEERLRDTGLIL